MAGRVQATDIFFLFRFSYWSMVSDWAAMFSQLADLVTMA